MKCARCTICGRRVYTHDAVEFGWFDEFGDGQAIVHRGRCEKRMTEFVFSTLLVQLDGDAHGSP